MQRGTDKEKEREREQQKKKTEIEERERERRNRKTQRAGLRRREGTESRKRDIEKCTTL